MHQYAIFITNAIFMHLFYSKGILSDTTADKTAYQSIKSYGIIHFRRVVLIGVIARLGTSRGNLTNQTR